MDAYAVATKIRSDEAEWLRISNQWNSTETTTMVDYFKIGLPSAVDWPSPSAGALRGYPP